MRLPVQRLGLDGHDEMAQHPRPFRDRVQDQHVGRRHGLASAVVNRRLPGAVGRSGAGQLLGKGADPLAVDGHLARLLHHSGGALKDFPQPLPPAT